MAPKLEYEESDELSNCFQLYTCIHKGKSKINPLKADFSLYKGCSEGKYTRPVEEGREIVFCRWLIVKWHLGSASLSRGQ
jgi:hypothetical protein